MLLSRSMLYRGGAAFRRKLAHVRPLGLRVSYRQILGRDAKHPSAIRALDPLANLDRPSIGVFDFDEAGWFRSRRAVEHDVDVAWHSDHSVPRASESTAAAASWWLSETIRRLDG
jgi:hypothetical protein